jgi:hypothetical protein
MQSFHNKLICKIFWRFARAKHIEFSDDHQRMKKRPTDFETCSIPLAIFDPSDKTGFNPPSAIYPMQMSCNSMGATKQGKIVRRISPKSPSVAE